MSRVIMGDPVSLSHMIVGFAELRSDYIHIYMNEQGVVNDICKVPTMICIDSIMWRASADTYWRIAYALMYYDIVCVGIAMWNIRAIVLHDYVSW